uniref:Putative tail protein n=1 Tax=viral metagenome TaxID=1070528 RepID=A0A6M3IRJ2_9ZZZZ
MRTPISQFELANPLYKNASVAFYTVASGVKTSTLATLYSGPTASAQLSNPQKLNSQGQFKQAVYIQDPVIGVVTGISVAGHDTGIISPAPTFRVQQSTGKLQYSYDGGTTWSDSGDYIFLNRGAWVTATSYNRNDMVYADGYLYICLVAHTSGVFATDLAASKWAQFMVSTDAQWAGTAGGTANALTLTVPNAITAYAAGLSYRFKSGAAANTAATTIAVSGLATKAIQRNGAALIGGEIEASQWYTALYDGAAFQLSSVGNDIVQPPYGGTVARNVEAELLFTGGVRVEHFMSAAQLADVESGACTLDHSSAFLAAITYLETRNAGGLSGGIVRAWGVKYNVSEIVIDQSHIMIEGASVGYAYNDQAYGTTFLCTTGKFAFALLYNTATGTSATGSGLRKCSIMSTAVDATAVEYGVLISASVTVMEDVCVEGFKRNISGLNFDANKFKRVSCLWGTQTGFELLHGSDVALCHPNVAAELAGLSALGSTTWSAEDMIIRRNYVGAVIRDGNAASMTGVVEGNYHHGLILFTRADGSNQHGPNYYNFEQMHFEGNFFGWAGADSSEYSLSNYNGTGDGVLACKTAAAAYLEGNVTGQWQSSQTGVLTGSDDNDAGYDVWIGSAIETEPTPGSVELYYTASTLCYGNKFDRCAFGSAGGSIKVRSGNHTHLKDCTMYYGAQNGASFGVNLTAYAQHTMLEDVTSRVDDLSNHTNATVIIKRKSGGLVGESMGLVIADRGAFISKKKTSTTTVVTSIGEYIMFTPGASKTVTLAPGNNVGGFMFLVSRASDGDGGLFFATYASATITKLAGGTGFIVGAAAGAAEVAVTKGANTNSVSVITGSGFTSQIAIQIIGSQCSTTGDPS